MDLIVYYVRECKMQSLPTSLREARKRDVWQQWKNAVEDEMQSIQRNKTWCVTILPNGRQPISCKWVLQIKRDEDGNIQRYKARLVARGFQQKSSIDYVVKRMCQLQS